jgi:DNA-binding NarL/FixJ family response regulator
MNAVRVALADDHPIVLMGIKALIEAEPAMVVSSASTDGLQALLAISADPPDVAVIDMSMPGMDGIALARRLKAVTPMLRLLALTVHEDEGYVQLALQAGVDGYLLKRSAAQELVRAIHHLAEGGLYLDPAVAVKEVVLPTTNTTSTAQLSDREAGVLRLLGQGFTTKEIAQRLSIGPKSVETYKSRASEKLGLRTRAQIVQFAIAQGWLAEL